MDNGTKILKFHGFGGFVSIIIDDHDANIIHYLRIFIDPIEFNDTIKEVMSHTNVDFEFLNGRRDLPEVCVPMRDVHVLGESLIHKVFVISEEVYLMGEGVPDTIQYEIIKHWETAVVNDLNAWWTDYRLVYRLRKLLQEENA